MDRKKFLISSTLSVFALTAFGSVEKGGNGQLTGDCDTTSDILGPFYRPNAPERADLTFEGLEGTPIKIKGTVRKPDCQTPLADALVKSGTVMRQVSTTTIPRSFGTVRNLKRMHMANMPLRPYYPGNT
jgi:hypothetical protein